MPQRLQRTIRRSVEACGIGFLTGADISLRFLPAGPNHGITFQRTDCPDSKQIPALVEFTVPRQRRTAIEHQGVVVEMVEHVLAALAGLQIDNCLVQLNAPEPPGLDGSCRGFVDALLEAGIVEQNEPRDLLVIEHPVRAAAQQQRSEVLAGPLSQGVLTIGYQLEYGPHSPIPPQNLSVEITPETFAAELAFARTFVLETEAEALRAQGYGRRTTAKDLLVFGSDGPIDNQLRAADECVRHKILDFIGDLALIGCDVCGRFSAYRSGHQLNREIVRRLKQAHPNGTISSGRRAA